MPSRVDNLQKRKAKAVSKGKDKKAANLTKKINKSMARQEERGMRKAKRQKINDYTKGVKTSGMRKKAKAERLKRNKESMAELKAYPQQVLGAAKQIAGLGKDKSVPQKVLKSLVREVPGMYVKGARDAATKTKKLVQKGVKAAGKGAKKVVSKVKNRKKKNK